MRVTPQRYHPMELRGNNNAKSEFEDNNRVRNVQSNLIKNTTSEEPRSYEEAIKSADANEWLEAMNEEMESLRRHNVWEFEELPPGVTPVDCRWVFKKKDIESSDGIKRFKARLVAKGFTQEKGIDYEQIYTPVSGFDTIRLLTALAVRNDWQLEQYDIKSAYLHSDLKEKTYMKQPKGFEKEGSGKLYCKLKKSICGLKQSGRCWNEHLDKKLKEAGFKRNVVDPCIYELRHNWGLAILAVYVDCTRAQTHRW